jgi:signal transduction histidine kinase
LSETKLKVKYCPKPATIRNRHYRPFITELLNNACKCTPAGESITISANLSADTVELKVCYSGVEIPNYELTAVFQPFYRFTNNAP